jgi:glycerol-3-phosphate dehydrogenase
MSVDDPPTTLRPLKRSMEVHSGSEPTDKCDVVVVGGGVNGTGVARDLSLRGLSVVLFERNDLAFGASGNSSGMIHGGPRYLSANPSVTESSCRDSGYIQKIAPFLLHRIPFLMQVRGGAKGRIMFELIDAFFRAYDDYQPLKNGEAHTRLTPDELRQLEPGLALDEAIGGITFDEWGVDGARLCVLNALDAMAHGAKVAVHTTVTGITKYGAGSKKRGEGDYVVTATDRDTGKVHRVRARVVVNATGAWAPITASLGALPNGRVRVRPGKGIHVALDRRLSNYAIAAEAIDGRQIFLMPWQNMSVIGTTDDDYYGDLDDVLSTSEEVRYLVQGVARVFPAVREARMIGTWAGVRPTLYAYGPHEDALSREHEIVDHQDDGAPGIYSMIGGKLASYRIFAEEMANRIAADLAPSTTCTTHTTKLPGAEDVPNPLGLAERFGLTPVTGRRAVYRHGAVALEVFGQAEARDRHEVVCPCEPVTAAEIRHVVKHELARDVAGVARRTRLGLGACGGMRCAARCGQIVAEELELAPSEGLAQAHRFLEHQAKMRVPALGPDQARQEAFAAAHLRATGVTNGGHR